MIWIVSSRRRIYWRGLIQLLTGGRTWDRRRGATWPETDYIYFYTAQNYYSYAPGLEKGYSLSWSGPSSVHPGTHGSRFETEHHSLFTCNTFTVNKPHMNIFVLSSFHSITQVRAYLQLLVHPTLYHYICRQNFQVHLSCCCSGHWVCSHIAIFWNLLPDEIINGKTHYHDRALHVFDQHCFEHDCIPDLCLFHDSDLWTQQWKVSNKILTSGSSKGGRARGRR